MTPACPPPPAASLRLTVDRNAIAANWRALDAMSGGASAGAAIKADAYGVGVDGALPALRDAGCASFFVAHWSEVPTALAHVPASALSVLHGARTAEECAYARATGAVPVINTVAQARLWSKTGGGLCHLMVDTGMNRLGIAFDDLADAAVAALSVDTVMSHLACADEDSAMNARQAERFAAILPQIPHRRASLANSAGIALGSAYHHDLTRPGIALYGGVVHPALAGRIRPVVGIEAALIQVRDVAAGESVGYGATFIAPRPMRIGIVSLGYADGYLRCWSDMGTFTHGGRALPVRGRVSMDMTAIDLTAAPDLREGDWVSIPYDLPEAARISGLTQYELLTVLGHRLRA